MCTVSFIPRPAGYHLAMNRDEQLARRIGLPPAARKADGCQVLCPSEPGGGTWIALNDSGTTLALINWYSVTARARKNPVSRGEIVPVLGALPTPGEVDKRIRKLPLARMNPFRLIGIFPGARRVREWRWNRKTLTSHSHRWRAQQWISSGFDEPTAQRTRGAAFRRAQQQISAGRLAWLRRVHASHRPERGPFSTCMHRADAATVSYTEVSVSRNHAGMRYHPGPPCRPFPCFRGRLRLAQALR